MNVQRYEKHLRFFCYSCFKSNNALILSASANHCQLDCKRPRAFSNCFRRAQVRRNHNSAIPRSYRSKLAQSVIPSRESRNYVQQRAARLSLEGRRLAQVSKARAARGTVRYFARPSDESAELQTILYLHVWPCTSMTHRVFFFSTKVHHIRRKAI